MRRTGLRRSFLVLTLIRSWLSRVSSCNGELIQGALAGIWHLGLHMASKGGTGGTQGAETPSRQGAEGSETGRLRAEVVELRARQLAATAQQERAWAAPPQPSLRASLAEAQVRRPLHPTP